MTSPPAPAPRQARDSWLAAPAIRAAVAVVRGRVRGAPVAVGVGQLLVVMIGILIFASAPFLGMPGSEWESLIRLSVVMLALVIVSVWLPWSRWAPWSSVCFPVLGLGGLLIFGLSTGLVAQAHLGVIPLWFVYAGVFLPRWSGAVLIPVAWFTYVAMVDSFSSNALVRLLIYSVAWFATSYTLSVLVSRQRAVSDGLRAESTRDSLTGLGNRRGLERTLADLQVGDCVVICDLDLFKSINDAFGHAAGDEVLRRFGATLNQQLRRRDYAARYGGEEFVLLLVNTTVEQARAFLTSFRDEWLDLGDGVTFSAGIAAVTSDFPPVAALSAADTALYEAKAAGRDCFRLAREVVVAVAAPVASSAPATSSSST